MSSGTTKGSCVPAERLARAGDLFGAERRAVRGGRAGLLRRAVADGGLGRRSGSAGRTLRRLERAAAIASVIVAVDAHRAPAGGLEALHLVGRVGERDRAVDRDAVVVEEDDQLVQPQVAGERDRLLADAFHQVAVAGEHIGVVVDEVVAEAARSACRSAIAMPTALARPWPSGPVVVSMPAAWPYSGWPGGLRAELAEVLELVDRHVLVAEEIEQRIEQHRAVAGGEHEAVAVRPVRVARHRTSGMLGEEHGGDVGHAHRQAGMAGIGLLAPRPWQGRGSHWPSGRARRAPCSATCGPRANAAMARRPPQRRHSLSKPSCELAGRRSGPLMPEACPPARANCLACEGQHQCEQPGLPQHAQARANVSPLD